MWFDKQSLVVRIVLLIPIWGWLTSGLYRIIKSCTGKVNVLGLVIGILCIVTGVVGFVMSIIDIITEITTGKISVLA
jgi:hypothetical protein